MKATVFEKLIRKVVREEIDYALRREIKSLKEDLREEFKSTIIQQPTQYSKKTTPIPSNVKSSLREKITGKSITQQFTSNNALNDLLNETAQGNTNTDSALVPTQETMPTEIANVVNRDYRELMRAIDNKKSSRP